MRSFSLLVDVAGRMLSPAAVTAHGSVEAAGAGMAPSHAAADARKLVSDAAGGGSSVMAQVALKNALSRTSYAELKRILAQSSSDEPAVVAAAAVRIVQLVGPRLDLVDILVSLFQRCVGRCA